ncbi:amidohydrolase [Gudongella sp. DL1XJH-153]|uniref:amidohydrolase n=1 Tax=Gudongella sp. DL1XJH-153 TaxID=3409804 RepID=UPI003BB4DD35
MDKLEFIEKVIGEKEELLKEASRKIWEAAELPYMEKESAEILMDILKNEGFVVEEGVADMPTAFIARYGQGKPVAGFLGEYDALDALSQKPGIPRKDPLVKDGPGHGCGHNLLGTGSLGAAIALKEYLTSTGEEGTVIYYGTPAEEGAGSKQFMAREGIFDEADFVYTWHPATKNGVQSDRTVAIMGANFRFKGLTSHAGGSPHLGRSALDAAELMSVGVNYLREHMIDQARIHYAYMDAGGVSPNVVQDRSLVKYEVRAPKVSQMRDLFDRVVDVAKGASLMTGTTVEHDITMAFSDYISNGVLAEIGNKCLMEVGPPKWNDEDYKLAAEFLGTYDKSTQKAIREDLEEIYGFDKVDEILKKPLDSMVHPWKKDNRKYSSGSTDVGDVSYVVPTLNFQIATACVGNVGHTWQMTAQSGSRIGEKGMLTAAKVMALSAIRTMEDRDAIKRAKDFVKIQNGGKYICPLPEKLKPPVGTY